MNRSKLSCPSVFIKSLSIRLMALVVSTIASEFLMNLSIEMSKWLDREDVGDFFGCFLKCDFFDSCHEFFGWRDLEEVKVVKDSFDFFWVASPCNGDSFCVFVKCDGVIVFRERSAFCHDVVL